MKTTIELSDDLAARAKKFAARRGTTLRAVIEESLRRTIRDDHNKPEFKLRDKRVKGKGLQAGFQNKSWAQIQTAAYAGRGG